MATAAATDLTPRYDAMRREAAITWLLTSVNTVGAWVPIGALTDIAAHIYASGFNGATISLFGTNEVAPVDGTLTNAKIVEDLQGNAMSFTANGLEGVGVVPRWICPQVSAGSLAGGVTATVALIMRKQARG
jgi:hypothetical protein